MQKKTSSKTDTYAGSDIETDANTDYDTNTSTDYSVFMSELLALTSVQKRQVCISRYQTISFSVVSLYTACSVLIFGCWNRGVPLYTEVSTLLGVGIEGLHCIQRCPHFWVLE